MKRSKPRLLAILLVIAAAFGVPLAVLGGGTPSLVLGAQLVSVADFGVSGNAANLTPGTGSPLTLDFTNPYTNTVDAITVQSVTITVSPTSAIAAIPASCPGTDLALQYEGATIPFAVPTIGSNTTYAQATVTFAAGNQPYVKANTTSAAPVTNTDVSVLLTSSAANPGCQNVTFPFNFSATGTYEDATASVVTASVNPASIGQSVTYTDTVTPSMSGESPSPTGTVTFDDGSSPIVCASSTAFTFNSGTNTGIATCTTTYTSQGSHSISATYSSSNTNYGGSTASPITETVVSSSCVTIATSGPNVTAITGTYGGNYAVLAGKTLYLNGGTITGNVTVNSGASLVTSGGTIEGNLSSTGGPIEFQGATTVDGNVSTTNSEYAVSAGTLIKGNLQVTGDAVFCALGTVAAPITIKGNLTVQQLSNGASNQYVCSVMLAGNLTYQQNGSPGFIGGTSSCGGSAISGNLTASGNTGPLTIGNDKVAGNLVIENNTKGITVSGNSATGNITVSGNSGGTLSSNSAGGNCTLSGDSPPVAGSSNTANGHNACVGSA